MGPKDGVRAGILLLLFCSISATRVHAGEGVETAGDVLAAVLPAAAAGAALVHRDGQGLLQFTESAALTLGATYGLKAAVREERPNGKENSFPSAHSSISFASAEFLRKRYGWGYGIPAYALAAFVAYSRVEAEEHYTHDVVAGAAIGIGSSWLFTRPYKGWHVQAEADGVYWGVRLSRDW